MNKIVVRASFILRWRIQLSPFRVDLRAEMALSQAEQVFVGSRQSSSAVPANELICSFSPKAQCAANKVNVTELLINLLIIPIFDMPKPRPIKKASATPLSKVLDYKAGSRDPEITVQLAKVLFLMISCPLSDFWRLLGKVERISRNNSRFVHPSIPFPDSPACPRLFCCSRFAGLTNDCS